MKSLGFLVMLCFALPTFAKSKTWTDQINWSTLSCASNGIYSVKGTHSTYRLSENFNCRLNAKVYGYSPKACKCKRKFFKLNSDLGTVFQSNPTVDPRNPNNPDDPDDPNNPDDPDQPGNPGGDGKHPNNGHGNDPDGNDSSNPGHSNNGDGTDADGSPGHSGDSHGNSGNNGNGGGKNK